MGNVEIETAKKEIWSSSQRLSHYNYSGHNFVTLITTIFATRSRDDAYLSVRASVPVLTFLRFLVCNP